MLHVAMLIFPLAVGMVVVVTGRRFVGGGK